MADSVTTGYGSISFAQGNFNGNIHEDWSISYGQVVEWQVLVTAFETLGPGRSAVMTRLRILGHRS